MARVLVVDDDELIRRAIGACLAATFDVETAENGRVALDRLRQERYDVVLLDLEMPEVDGAEFMREFCARRLSSRVLICSGAPGVEARARQLGADGVLPKPFDVATVRAAVAALTHGLAPPVSGPVSGPPREALAVTSAASALPRDARPVVS